MVQNKLCEKQGELKVFRLWFEKWVFDKVIESCEGAWFNGWLRSIKSFKDTISRKWKYILNLV